MSESTREPVEVRWCTNCGWLGCRQLGHKIIDLSESVVPDIEAAISWLDEQGSLVTYKEVKGIIAAACGEPKGATDEL